MEARAVAQDHLVAGHFQVENYCRVKACDATLDGGHLVITGKNGSGKSSLLQALWDALCGHSKKTTPEPIRHGADKAHVRIELIDRETRRVKYIVDRHWTEKATRLVVSAPDGSTFKNAQELLDGLVDEYTLSPAKFLDQRPQDQIEDVLRVCGVKAPTDAVTEITGEDHPAIADETASQYLERLFGDDRGLFYHRRRDAHRTVQQKEAAHREQRETLDQLGGPLAESEKPPSAGDVVKRIEALNQKTANRAAVAGEVQRLTLEKLDVENRLAGLERDSVAKDVEAATVEAHIRELQTRLQTIRADKAAIAARIAKGREVLDGAAKDVAAGEAALAKLPDPAGELRTLRQQLGTVEEAGKKIAKRQQAQEQLDRLAAEVKESREAHGKAELIVERGRALRGNLLNGIDIGVQGLTIGDGELRLNDVPFRQASQAEKIRVACALAFRRNPQVKILRIDEAENLDSDSMRLVRQEADRYGWQVLAAFVRDSQELKFEIVQAGAAV